MNEITVANVTTSLVEYKGNPVCTTKQLSEFYGSDPEHIQDNHRKNSDRFEEGKHFVKLAGADLKKFMELLPDNFRLQISSMTRSLVLWTERGAARHAKMLSTDKAWEVFEELEDVYFRAKKAEPELLRQEQTGSGLPQFRKARALDMATKTAERICWLVCWLVSLWLLCWPRLIRCDSAPAMRRFGW